MKKTKYALLSCGIALMLSVILFAGTTFAWFTSNITNKNNSIAMGTLTMAATRYTEGQGGRKITDGNTAYTFSINGQALNEQFQLSSTAMGPGESQAQLITIQNTGSLDGVLKLSVELSETNTDVMDKLTFKLAEVKGEQALEGTLDTLPTTEPLTADINANETKTYLLIVSVKPDRSLEPEEQFNATIHPVIEQKNQTDQTESGQ